MDCAPIREALSARLDGEDPGIDTAVLDAHLDGCVECRRWATDLTALHRSTRVRAAEPVPDLTAAILEAAPGAPRRSRRASAWSPLGQPISAARWALFVVALTQLALAVPTVLFGDDANATVHVTREMGSFDLALAVGLLVAAWQPARAWGLLPVAGALGLVLGGTAVLDVMDGSASTLGEAAHLVDLAGVVLLWLVARETRSARGGAPSPARWSTA